MAIYTNQSLVISSYGSNPEAPIPSRHIYSRGHMLPQILTSFSTLIVQCGRQRKDELFKVSMLQCLPYLLVRIRVKWIKVHAQRSREQDRILPIHDKIT